MGDPAPVIALVHQDREHRRQAGETGRRLPDAAFLGGALARDVIGADRVDAPVAHRLPQGLDILPGAWSRIDFRERTGGRMLGEMQVLRAALDVDRRPGIGAVAPYLVERLLAAQVHDVHRTAGLAREVADAMHVLRLEEVRALLVPRREVVAARRTQAIAEHGNDFGVLAVHAQHRPGQASRPARARERATRRRSPRTPSRARPPLCTSGRASTSSRRSARDIRAWSRRGGPR